MADELKKEQDLDNEQDLNIETDGHIEEKNQEDVVIENEDPLNINIALEDINDLTEEECDILLVKIEVAIDKCEDELEKAYDTFEFNVEALAKNKETEDELKRLNGLNKLVLKHKHAIKTKTKEGGLFGNLPVWAFVLFIVCALFTIVPINPYFPIELYLTYSEKIESTFINSIEGAYFCYFMYIGLFIIIELVLFIILLIKGLKSKEKMGTFKSYLVMFIINLIIDIPGVIIFLHAALNS